MAMGYSLVPYLVDHSSLLAVYGSKDNCTFERIATADSDYPESNAKKMRAVRAIIDGDLASRAISPEDYGYGWELVCAALGRLPTMGFGLCGFKSSWLEKETPEIFDTLCQSAAALIPLPESQYGLPGVCYLTRKIIAERLSAFGRLEDSNRPEDVKEATAEFVSWLQQAADANSDMVVFLY